MPPPDDDSALVVRDYGKFIMFLFSHTQKVLFCKEFSIPSLIEKCYNVRVYETIVTGS